MDRSDAYVISNPNSYQGFMVSIEFGYATYSILNSCSELKKIYFTNVPLGYDKFELNPNLSFDTFLKNLHNNPKYQNELDFYNKIANKKDPNFSYPCERDFYTDLQEMYAKVLLLQSQGKLVIGLDSLLDKSNGVSQPRILQDEDEYEL